MADTKQTLFNFNNYEIVCPYCGYEETDSWEYTEDEDEIECPHCEKKFIYCRDIQVKYTTHRIKNNGEIDYFDELIEEEQDA